MTWNNISFVVVYPWLYLPHLKTKYRLFSFLQCPDVWNLRKDKPYSFLFTMNTCKFCIPQRGNNHKGNKLSCKYPWWLFIMQLFLLILFLTRLQWKWWGAKFIVLIFTLVHASAWIISKSYEREKNLLFLYHKKHSGNLTVITFIYDTLLKHNITGLC